MGHPAFALTSEVREKGPKVDDEAEHQDGVRVKPTRHLGSIDEWGIGGFESAPDSNTGARASYAVNATHVLVTRLDGQQLRVDRTDAKELKINESDLQVRLCQEMVVQYDINVGTTNLTFFCKGGSPMHTFRLGEIWRCPGGHIAALNATHVTPANVFDGITHRWQNALDTKKAAMEGHTTGMRTLIFKDTMTSPCVPNPQRDLGVSLSKSMPALPTSGLELLSTAKTLCDDRHAWTFEHNMRKHCNTKHPMLAKTAVGKKLKDQFVKGDRPVIPKPDWSQPISLRVVSSKALSAKVTELEGSAVLVAVLVTADWAMKSTNNSCQHARSVCESAYGDMRARGFAERIQFLNMELTEAGAIHSTGKNTHAHVKEFGVKEAPWLLLFFRGKLVFSEKPASDQRIFEGTPASMPAGGIGFAKRMNYPTLARPRCLILAPIDPADILHNPMVANASVKLQMEAQDALRRSQIQFDVAVSAAEARRMATNAKPPYRLLIGFSDCGANILAEIAGRLVQRSPEALSFAVHDATLGEVDGLRGLVERGTLAGVLKRPLTKSQIDRALLGKEAAQMKYPKAGVTKATLVTFLEQKLTSM